MFIDARHMHSLHNMFCHLIGTTGVSQISNHAQPVLQWVEGLACQTLGKCLEGAVKECIQ